MHNYNNFHAETESVAGLKKKFLIGFQTAQAKKRCAQGFLAFDKKEMAELLKHGICAWQKRAEPRLARQYGHCFVQICQVRSCDVRLEIYSFICTLNV
jgi:hypothetical protein